MDEKAIEAVWERHHIERIPRHDMSNECRLAAVILALEDKLEQAWGVIANAGGGAWSRETPEWQEAAARFRTEYHEMLGLHAGKAPVAPKAPATKTDMDLLGFDAYQNFTQTTARYPGRGEASAEALAYTACGLAGEVGEALQPLIERLQKTQESIPGSLAPKTDDVRMLGRLLATLIDFDECARELELMKREFREKEAKLPPLVAVPAEYTAKVMKELGDVAWYIATHAQENKLQLSWVIAENIRKLRDRAARGTLHGKGDNR